MKKSDLLKQERAGLNQKQQGLIDLAKTEKRDFNETENTEFDARTEEIRSFDSKIERELEKEAVELRTFKAKSTEEVVPVQRDAEAPVFSIRSQMKNGKLEGAELEAHTRAMQLASDAKVATSGVAIPLSRAAQTVTGDAGAKGGNLVATDLQSPIDFLRPQPLMAEMGAAYISNLTGNLRFPKNSGGIVASWEGETDTTDETANAYGYVDSIPKRLSVTVPISLQNLMQSSVDLEMYTIKEINQAIGNALDLAAVNGSGTGQPLGILNNADVNQIATGADGSAPSWDLIVDSETRVFVENANAAKMNYLVNPKTRGKLKKTKHEAGDLNYIMGVDGSVNGYDSGVSNHVPSNLTKGTGTALSAMIFGDFSQLLINQWGFMDLSVDEYSRKKEGLVEITVNVFADVLVKQPKAFSVVKGLITV
jgi:HK97 family phage major capsid protein